jgi:hypothetical protein
MYYSRIMTASVIGIAAISTTAPAFAQQNLTVNGSFEMSNVPALSYRYKNNPDAPVGNSGLVANPWQFSDYSGVSTNAGFTTTSVFDGNAFAFIQANGDVSQGVQITTPGSYQISLKVSGRPASGSLIGGNTNYIIYWNNNIVYSGSTTSGQPFANITCDVNAVLGLNTLKISAISSQSSQNIWDNTLYIDNVSIVSNAPPPPSALNVYELLPSATVPERAGWSGNQSKANDLWIQENGSVKVVGAINTPAGTRPASWIFSPGGYKVDAINKKITGNALYGIGAQESVSAEALSCNENQIGGYSTRLNASGIRPCAWGDPQLNPGAIYSGFIKPAEEITYPGTAWGKPYGQVNAVPHGVALYSYNFDQYQNPSRLLVINPATYLYNYTTFYTEINRSFNYIPYGGDVWNNSGFVYDGVQMGWGFSGTGGYNSGMNNFFPQISAANDGTYARPWSCPRSFSSVKGFQAEYSPRKYLSRKVSLTPPYSWNILEGGTMACGAMWDVNDIQRAFYLLNSHPISSGESGIEKYGGYQEIFGDVIYNNKKGLRSVAYDVNLYGQVVGEVDVPNQGTRGFYWDEDAPSYSDYYPLYVGGPTGSMMPGVILPPLPGDIASGALAVTPYKNLSEFTTKQGDAIVYGWSRSSSGQKRATYWVIRNRQVIGTQDVDELAHRNGGNPDWVRLEELRSGDGATVTGQGIKMVNGSPQVRGFLVLSAFGAY